MKEKCYLRRSTGHALVQSGGQAVMPLDARVDPVDNVDSEPPNAPY